MIAALALAVVIGGCRKANATPVPGGNSDRGARAIKELGCGTCHQIPGVPGANGLVGPPLDDVARRAILAGELPNSPANMARWIRDPQSVEPNTAMPNLSVDEQSARDFVAYLYSIRR